MKINISCCPKYNQYVYDYIVYKIFIDLGS